MKRLSTTLFMFSTLPTFAGGELGAWDEVNGGSSGFPIGSIIILIIIILYIIFSSSSNNKKN